MTERKTEFLSVPDGGNVTPEQIQASVDNYLDQNPVQAGATAEQAAQIEQNTADIAELKQAGGTPGADGKSAYQYAVDGGYTGTESDFTAKMAQETYSKTDIDAALNSYISDVAMLIGGDA